MVRPGASADRYQRLRHLGEGASGSVWLVEDSTNPGSRLALKELTEQALGREASLRREFATLSALHHPNCVQVHEFDLGSDSSLPRFTMEYVDGDDILVAVRKGGGASFLQFTAEALRALGFLHDFGLIHRDLKPANLLVRHRVERGGRVVLLDFGLAVRSPDDLAGGAAGTLPYMAPELFEGATPSVGTDLYALGAVLFEAVCGTPPFGFPKERNLAGFLDAVRGEKPVDVSVPDDYPPGIAMWLHEMLAGKPEDRPAKAAEALARLNQFCGCSFPLETSDTLRARLAFGPPPGRDLQVAEMWEHLESTDTPRVLWLCGGPGSGKTRLLKWINSEAVRRGWDVSLRLTSDIENAPPHHQQARTLISLDDGELAASRIVALVTRLLQRCEPPGPAVVVALRAEELADASLNALLQQAEVSPAMRRLDLRPLDVHGLREMIERATGTTASATRANWLFEQSEGNALVAESLIIEEAWQSGRSVKPADVLAAALSRRTKSAPQSALPWLEACCVLAGEAQDTTVSEVAGVSDEVGRRAATELQTLGLVRRGKTGWLPDSMALARYVTDSLPVPKRTALHERAAESLIAQGVHRIDPSRVATHLAAAGRWERVGRLALRAAKQSLSRGATSEAANYFSLALRALGRKDREKRYKLRLRQGRTLLKAGRNKDAVRAFGGAVIAANDQHARIVAKLGQARALINVGRLDRADQLIQETGRFTAKARRSFEAAFGTSMLGMILLRKHRDEEAATTLESAAVALRHFGRSSELVECLHLLGWIESRLGRSGAVTHLNDALEVSSEIGDFPNHLKVLFSLSTHLGRSGQHDEARKTAYKLRDTADRVRDPSALRLALVQLGNLAFERGEWDVAASLSQEIESLALRFGEPTSVLRARNLRADALLGCGRPAIASEIMRAGLEDPLLNRAELHMRDLLKVTLAEALSQLSSGSSKEVHQLLAASLRGCRRRHDAVRTWRVANLLFELRVLQRAANKARMLATILEQAPENDPHIVGFESKTRFHIAKARHLLQQGRYQEAELEAERAGELAGRGDQPSFGAVARGVAAEACERRGDERAAAQHLEQGRALLEQAALRIADSEMRRDFLARPLFRRLREEAGGTADARLLALYEMIGALSSERDIDQLLESILDMALKVVQAERGMILLLDPDDRSFSVRLVRNLEEETEKDAEAFSRSVIERAGSGESVLAVDAGRDDRFRSLRSVSLFGIRSLMCVPLRLRERIVGTVYLDSRSGGTVFTREDLRFVEAFADHAALALDNARELERLALENVRLRREAESKVRFENIVGESPAMERVFALMSKVAASELPVLIQGESGTGKELVARAIHFHGPRRDSACLTENCAAIPETLLESELFGHVRGAFTGAERDRAGLFEEADGGTLFLDEIGDMSPAMQARLLRVLQEGEIRRVGGERPIAVDVRVIAASHRDLEQEVEAGRFREDLLYRLKVLVVRLPPLRERVGDIRLLVDFLLERIAAERGRERPRISVEVMERLERYRWPGNVRQLQNVLQRLALLAGSGPIDLALLETDRELGRLFDAGKRAAEPLYSLEANERERIRSALEQARGNRSRAARMLGISRATIYRKLRAYGLG